MTSQQFILISYNRKLSNFHFSNNRQFFYQKTIAVPIFRPDKQGFVVGLNMKANLYRQPNLLKMTTICPLAQIQHQHFLCHLLQQKNYSIKVCTVSIPGNENQTFKFDKEMSEDRFCDAKGRQIGSTRFDIHRISWILNFNQDSFMKRSCYVISFKPTRPVPPQWLLLGSPMPMEPQLSQLDAGTVFQPQQENNQAQGQVDLVPIISWSVASPVFPMMQPPFLDVTS